ncbi:nudix hydrolase 15, mitochondrial-like isoform X2 [Musa acuminata AAA Group]|uniref:nudix hydrolase 15, mitochondrial-like isoform X2 n=1 Tax=Musa acuminata AAA Group TaxID=214697 RepID=UPI0031E35F9A
MNWRSALTRASAMAASPGPNQNALSNLAASGRSSHRLLRLAQQLRLYRPSPLSSDADETVVDDRGKVFSAMALPESAAAAAAAHLTGSGATEKLAPKRAAVLVCLFEGDRGEFRVILTKRSSNLSTHSGEVSLPGGKADEGDADDRETALREAKEEIGLDPSLVTIVAVLEPFLSKTLQHLSRLIPVFAIPVTQLLLIALDITASSESRPCNRHTSKQAGIQTGCKHL